jgi:hypothetical protein
MAYENFHLIFLDATFTNLMIFENIELFGTIGERRLPSSWKIRGPRLDKGW